MSEQTAEEWGERYATGFTPWDVGGPHPELVARLAEGRLPEPGRALVPGCGYGHDAVALAQAGWQVTAVDFAPELQQVVPKVLAPYGGRFLNVDALGLEVDEPFDLIFDHTFFCAIHPSRRPEHGAMVRRLLGPGGTLAMIVYPPGEPVTGPPWGMEPSHVLEALGPGFEVLAHQAVGHPVPRRENQERWLEIVRSGG